MGKGYKTILLKQHIGAPATALVSVGDEVRPGSLLAKPEKLGARIFSSTAGRVKELTDSAVVIEESGEQPEDFVKIEPEDEELLSFVRAAGVVGMGGAGFPTGMKWSFVPQDNPNPK